MECFSPCHNNNKIIQMYDYPDYHGVIIVSHWSLTFSKDCFVSRYVNRQHINE